MTTTTEQYQKGLKMGRALRTSTISNAAAAIVRAEANLARARENRQPLRVSYNEGVLAGLKGR